MTVLRTDGFPWTPVGLAAKGVALALGALATVGPAAAQSLTILPVNIQLAPGQNTTTLTVINHGEVSTGIQVRALAWSQPSGAEELTPSDSIFASPPIATIAPGGTQIVRLVLRHPPQGQEATYRVLLDQIPPVAPAGTVRIALRLSIPVFAQATRRRAHVQFHIENDAGTEYLVAVNDGGAHETMRDIVLTTSNGTGLKTRGDTSPYILAGATRRWAIVKQDVMPASGESLRLTCREDSGAVDLPVVVVASR